MPVLVSYYYAAIVRHAFERVLNHPNTEVLLDSGGFTAKTKGEDIKLDAYCAFLDEYKDKLAGYMALDVVGNPKRTKANLKAMHKAGYKPIPIHVLGDDKKRLDELFELSDWVALAGFKRPGKGHCPPSYVAMKMQWAKQRKVHWLGYVRDNMIARYSPYSCDSSSWGYAHRFGQLAIYFGNGRWAPIAYQRSADKIANDRKAINQLRRLGYSKQHLANPHYWRQTTAEHETNMTMRVNADSYVRYALDIKHYFQTRLFIASRVAGKSETDTLIEAIERNASA